jgi:DNA-binding MarR family transcriptional regulator
MADRCICRYLAVMSEIHPRSHRSPCTCLDLRKASRRVTQIYDAELAGTGLTITQYGILGHLKSLDGIALGAFADVLVMDATTLVRTLKPLQHRGFVASSTRADDKRTRRLHLTAAGRAAYEAARPAWKRAQATIDASLGAAGGRALTEAIGRLLSLATPDATPLP